MCITLMSTAHPAFPFILLSNRDEFFSRPTARAHWWEEPHRHVLAGRDLQRQEKGTWLGITSDGRIAVLTNFREEGLEVSKSKSRGGITNAWLTPTVGEAKDVEDFADELIHGMGIHDVGGFTLVFGRLREDRDGGLALISNRTATSAGLAHLATSAGETHGLSNSHYGDTSWPKVVQGEHLLNQAIRNNVDAGDSKGTLIQSLFDVLSVDTLPKRRSGEPWIEYARQLRNSIFIPPVGGETVDDTAADELASDSGDKIADATKARIVQGVYGTTKQTVALVDTEGKVTWVERTLHDEKAQPIHEDARDVKFDFHIREWKSR